MITFSMLSEIGSRSNNEDNIGMFQKDDSYCFILADGLGGHGKGEVASQIAVETSVMTFASEDGTFDTYIARAFEQAQGAIVKRQEEDRSAADMKTTLVVLTMDEKEAQWGHVGDSRLYHFYKNKMIERTADHSVPQLLVMTGEIKEKQIRHHPDRNRLLRVMGASKETPRFETGEKTALRAGDAFLMCTDGFWELIEEKKMEACLKKASDPQEWLSLMKSIVLKNGAGTDMDNYSAIAVWVR
ncbi:MAG: PP2C family protein-serine/threonine phosphatase [Enterocloster sp.]